MISFIDSFLLKSGMPKEELCIIAKTKRAFYYTGILTLGAAGIALLALDIFNLTH